MREVPEDMDNVNVYKEPPEDRVKFYYDCFVNIPQRTETKVQNGDALTVDKDTKSPHPAENTMKSKEVWHKRQLWSIVIAFDILLLAIVFYIYS